MDQQNSRDQDQIRQREFFNLLDEERDYYRRWYKVYYKFKYSPKYIGRVNRHRCNLLIRMARHEQDQTLSGRDLNFYRKVQSIFQKSQKKYE